MSWQILPYDAQRDAEEWDALCAKAPMATFLHTRRFLSYHGERFEDQSCVARDAHGRLGAVLPAARSLSQADCVISHPGASFGGLIHAGSVLGDELIAILSAMARHYAGAGFASLRYKAVPSIYQRWPAQDDRYALFRLGATLYRSDLSSSIALDARQAPASRRQRSLRKALKAGLTLGSGPQALEAFWPMLCASLHSRHGVSPVHSLAEMQLLMKRFPQEIQLVCASLDGDILAGVLLFDSACVSHAQYTASSEQGNHCSALDAVFEHCIDQARQSGKRYFDFGVSTENEGQQLNAGLYCFKSEFGGGGMVHEFFELALG